jgi:uncharacterized protein involved in exopolysaccharide biosynthesis
MTPRRSLVGKLAVNNLLSTFRRRALVFGTAAALTGVLAFFPERHLASSSFTPSDRDSLGLSGTLGQLGAVGSVFGNQAAVEVALRIGNSDAVRDIVIANTFLKDDLKAEGRTALQRYLRREVTVRSLRGGIVLIEMQHTDAELAQELVAAYQVAIQNQLGRVARRQTAYKREILKKLVKESSEELAEAEAAYDNFRLQNRYTDPRGRIGALGDRVNQLEGLIQSKEIDLYRARQIYTDGNLTIRQKEVELEALRNQLAEAKALVPDNERGVGDLVRKSSELYKLERDFETAKGLYNGYVRYLRGTSVEDLAADANLRVLEAPHVVTERQIWLPLLALCLAILLLWGAIEAYRLRPPPGSGLKEPANA